MKAISLLSLEANEITRSCFGLAACVLLNLRTVCTIIFLSLVFIFFLGVKMIQVSFLYASYKTLETCKDIGKIVLKFLLLETDKHCDVKNCLLKHFKMRAKMVPDACLRDECNLQFG